MKRLIQKYQVYRYLRANGYTRMLSTTYVFAT
jgi:hypothetical protein